MAVSGMGFGNFPQQGAVRPAFQGNNVMMGNAGKPAGQQAAAPFNNFGTSGNAGNFSSFNPPPLGGPLPPPPAQSFGETPLARHKANRRRHEEAIDTFLNGLPGWRCGYRDVGTYAGDSPERNGRDSSRSRSHSRRRKKEKEKEKRRRRSGSARR
mmetsp:Transcript_6980/g.11244  ORF Transcript_6980/g.11244 Transcript_6980/m.11244 type:complete len:155 (+) Transcript_6980:102-566(+)